MKISKILVSVNVAAVIPVAVQAAAGASESKVDTGEWLKDSISSLDKPAISKSSAVSRAVARAKSVSHTGTSFAVIRPFVPNRPLPHRADLELALKAQEPKMAPEPVTTLVGKISSFDQSEGEGAVSAYGASAPRISKNSAVGLRQTKTRTERVADMTRNLFKAMPQASTPNIGNRAINIVQDLSLATRDHSTIAPQFGFPLMRQAEHHLLDNTSGPENESSTVAAFRPPVRNEMNTTVESADQLDVASTTGSAGPPPFPLNLLPEASLKKFIRGSMGPSCSHAPRVYFGSWHGTNLAHSLPPGGFHVYSPYASRSYASGSRSYVPRMQRYASRPSATRPETHLAYSSRRYVIARHGSAAAKPAEPRVAAYPPYAASSALY